MFHPDSKMSTLRLFCMATLLALAQSISYSLDGKHMHYDISSRPMISVAPTPMSQIYNHYLPHTQTFILAVIGSFENLDSHLSMKQPTDFVHLYRKSETSFLWTDRTGSNFTLHLDFVKGMLNRHQLNFCTGSSYYKQGYRHVSLIWNTDGSLRHIVLPNDVKYTRLDAFKDSIIGAYENMQYNYGGKDSRHYVEIQKGPFSTLYWMNKKGQKWTLSIHQSDGTYDRNNLVVGKDCPHYQSGYHVAKILRNVDGSIRDITGPLNENFLRIEDMFQSVLGDYENQGVTDGGRNPWHFGTITKTSYSMLRWTNNAGVSWTMSIFHTHNGFDPNYLSVFPDSPQYQTGYRKAEVIRNSDGIVTALLGPAKEPFAKVNDLMNSLVGSYEHFRQYGASKKTSHYVNVSYVDEETILWMDKSGNSWRLYLKPVIGGFDRSRLIVDKECPYYKEGYIITTILWNGDGTVKSITGPGSESYSRVEDLIQSVEGCYEREDATSDLKDDKKFITIEKTSFSSLLWKDRSGLSWTLHVRQAGYEFDSNSFVVEMDSTFYKSGFEYVHVVRHSDGSVRGLRTPDNHLYLRVLF